MSLALFSVREDARVWAYSNYSFDIHFNYLGPVSCFSPTYVPLRFTIKGGWRDWWLNGCNTLCLLKGSAILCPCCFTAKLMFACAVHKLISAFIWNFLTLSVRLCLLGGGIILKNKTQSVLSRTYYENIPLSRELQCSDCDKYCE